MPVVAPLSEPMTPLWGPLIAPHARTQRVLMSPVLRWSFSLPQGLPEGLAFFLGRINPALAVRSPLQAPLLEADRAVLGALAQAGWLHQAPQLSLSLQGKAADTPISPGRQGRTTIQAALDPTAALAAIVPPPADLDPVFLRWLVLFHEAGHTERGELTQPIQVAGWPAPTVGALNALVFDSGDLMGPARDRFDEAFADAFGARVLLQLSRNAPAARQAIAYLARLRDAQAQDAAHGNGEALQALLDQPFVPQSPTDVRQAAQANAGTTLLAWLAAQGDPGLSWAQDPQALDWAAYRVRDYLEAREMAYAEGQAGVGAYERAGRSPLLQALAEDDADLLADFETQVPAEARQRYRAYLAGHAPGGTFVSGGADPRSEEPAFEAWLDQATAKALARHAAVVPTDQAAFAADARQVQAQWLAREPARPRRRP